MKRTYRSTLAAGGGLLALALVLSGPAFGAHPDVTLRDTNGNAIDVSAANPAPYSPRSTCGTCHSYDTITAGYHFQQGFDQISDTYSEDKPWLLSPGMAGKW